MRPAPAAMAPGIRLLPRPFPRVAELMDEAEDDVLAYVAFPVSTGADLVEQSAGESQQGDQAAHERGGISRTPHDCARWVLGSRAA